MPKKKKQHYVPQFYLSYFLDQNRKNNEEPYLWVFEVPNEKGFRKSPKNIGFENYFYSFQDGDEFSYEIEDRLAEIESEAKYIFKKMINNNLIKDERERYTFGKFISFLNYRTPRSRDHFRILAQNKLKGKMVDEMNKSGGVAPFLKKHGKEFIPEDFMDSFNKIKIIPPKIISIEFMIQAVKIMIPEICVRNWLFLAPKSLNKSFITSDSPVLLFNENNKDENFIPGIKDEKTHFVFPITPRVCFYASFNYASGYKTISDYDVISINRAIAGACNKYIFSSCNVFNTLFYQ